MGGLVHGGEAAGRLPPPRHQGCRPHQEFRDDQVLNKWLDATNEIRRMRWIEQKGAAHFAKVLGSRIMRAWRSQSFVLATQDGDGEEGGSKDGRPSHETLVEDMAVARRR